MRSSEERPSAVTAHRASSKLRASRSAAVLAWVSAMLAAADLLVVAWHVRDTASVYALIDEYHPWRALAGVPEGALWTIAVCLPLCIHVGVRMLGRAWVGWAVLAVVLTATVYAAFVICGWSDTIVQVERPGFHTALSPRVELGSSV